MPSFRIIPSRRKIAAPPAPPEEGTVTAGAVRQALSGSDDFQDQTLSVGDMQIAIFSLDGMVSSGMIAEHIIRPLMSNAALLRAESPQQLLSAIVSGGVFQPYPKKQARLEDVILSILQGCVSLVIDELHIAVTYDVKSFERRAVAPPTNASVVNGAKDAFVETLRTNTSLIRRKIRSKDLLFETILVGRQTQTPVCIISMDNIVNDRIRQKLRERLASIDTDNMLTISMLIEFIHGRKYNILPVAMVYERVDQFCSYLVEGSVGLIIDGIPVGMILPATLAKCFQTAGDYEKPALIASILKVLRWALALVALYMPGFYIAVTTHHQEMLPEKMAIFIQTAKEGVPFPAYIEVLLMLIAFEVLIEASQRMSSTIGATLSIVGGLVVGQAAVEARLVSPAVVVIIALSSIASFSIPNMDMANVVRIWRFVIAVSAAILGLYIMMITSLFLLITLADLEVMGVPYLSPLTEGGLSKNRDVLIRSWLPGRKRRPGAPNPKNVYRRGR